MENQDFAIAVTHINRISGGNSIFFAEFPPVITI